MSRVASILFGGLFACSLIASTAGRAVAADAAIPSTSASASVTAVPDLFEAEERQLVSIKYIPNDAKSAQILVTNRTRRPLTLRLPAAFAGIPVLAQMGGMGMGGGMGQVGFGAGGIGGGPQATGGGGGFGGQGMNGMGGGGMGMGGGGAFSIPPEKTRAFRVPTVCLEHGKHEPSSRMPYKFCRVDSFSSDPKLAVVLESLGRGQLSQKVAQAAAWHVANGLSWEKLAAEMIDHAGGTPDEPYFSRAELLAAHHVVAIATQEASRRLPAGQSAATAKNTPAQ